MKESDLHIKLKNPLGYYLSLEVGNENVTIDKVYKNEAISLKSRKPDVLANLEILRYW